MKTTMNIQSGSRTSLLRQVAAVGIGAAVAFVGAFLAVLGALVGSAHGGLAILVTPTFVIARLSKREGWLVRGALGLATGPAAFFLGREAVTLVGSDAAVRAIILPSFGLAAVVALPARDRWLLAARVVGVFALSMIPAVIHDGEVFGGEVHGRFLIGLTLLGLVAGLFLPSAIRRPGHRSASAAKTDKSHA